MGKTERRWGCRELGEHAGVVEGMRGERGVPLLTWFLIRTADWTVNGVKSGQLSQYHIIYLINLSKQLRHKIWVTLKTVLSDRLLTRVNTTKP